MITPFQELESRFNGLSKELFGCLLPNEHLSLNLIAEDTQFIRFNASKVRQIGAVRDGLIRAKFVSRERTISIEFVFTGDCNQDVELGRHMLERARGELTQIPTDPYGLIPQNHGSSRTHNLGALLDSECAAEALLKPVQNLDFSGIYAGGGMIRAQSNSAGQSHWFSTESYSLDYSLFHKSGKAIKSTFAGTHWSAEKYQAEINSSHANLEALNLPVITLKPGQYRAYFSPAATHELLGMFNWYGLAESSLRQSESAFLKLRNNEATFSEHFSITEDFRSGLVPRFNDNGELSQEVIPLIQKGQLVNTLVNSRTAKEYGITSNGANTWESLRSPEISTGSLNKLDILKTLGTGVYLSNLHYLNWSDVQGARITGMTRYAPLWVEKGEIKGPITDMRFDDSLYSFLGPQLEAVTSFNELMPEVSTYGHRQLGAARVPGLLLKSFSFTL